LKHVKDNLIENIKKKACISLVFLTYVLHGIYYCFVDYMKVSWCTKPDGTLEAPVLDSKKFYFCVVRIAHSHLRCPFSLPLIHSFYRGGLQFRTRCILLVEDLYNLLEGYLWRKSPVLR
jgi:hypothetical protein